MSCALCPLWGSSWPFDFMTMRTVYNGHPQRQSYSPTGRSFLLTSIKTAGSRPRAATYFCPATKVRKKRKKKALAGCDRRLSGGGRAAEKGLPRLLQVGSLLAALGCGLLFGLLVGFQKGAASQQQAQEKHDHHFHALVPMEQAGDVAAGKKQKSNVSRSTSSLFGQYHTRKIGFITP